ncbi:hypothetical protein BV22DRAFT_1120226 [Leucogyrophana mollusca]|uniref:Uncharacterized protein n=1 Tax=Leucogyrophana mollusca TaxID=85980 RepID=A0ACB8BHL9_9AGAM|nr:hypothetical protein BV22DRAFT_1120226 [Leucogyrophana mollusca]
MDHCTDHAASIDCDALVAALERELSSDDWFPTREHIAKELGEINSALMDQFNRADIRTYGETCTRLKGLLDSGLLFMPDELKEVVDTIKLSFLMYEDFAHFSLLVEHSSRPPDVDDLPSDLDVRAFIIGLIDQQLKLHDEGDDLHRDLTALKLCVQTRASTPESSDGSLSGYASPFDWDFSNYPNTPEDEKFIAGCISSAKEGLKETLRPPAPASPIPPFPPTTVATNPDRKPRPLGPSASLPLLPSMTSNAFPLTFEPALNKASGTNPPRTLLPRRGQKPRASNALGTLTEGSED